MKTGRLLELRGASKGHLSTDRKIDLGVPTATKPLHAAHDHQSACLSQERFSGFQVFSHISQRQRKQTLTLKPVADMIGSPESQTKAIKSRQQKKQKKMSCRVNARWWNHRKQQKMWCFLLLQKSSSLCDTNPWTILIQKRNRQSASKDHVFCDKTPKPVGLKPACQCKDHGNSFILFLSVHTMTNPVAHTFQSKELSNLTAVMNQNGKHEPRVVEFFLRFLSTTHFIQYVSAIIFSNKLLPTVFWARLFCNYFEHIAWTFVLERDSWTHLSEMSGSFFQSFLKQGCAELKAHSPEKSI